MLRMYRMCKSRAALLWALIYVCCCFLNKLLCEIFWLFRRSDESVLIAVVWSLAGSVVEQIVMWLIEAELKVTFLSDCFSLQMLRNELRWSHLIVRSSDRRRHLLLWLCLMRVWMLKRAEDQVLNLDALLWLADETRTLRVWRREIADVTVFISEKADGHLA